MAPTATVLSALRIENLAIVDRVDLAFGPGLNVLTGETGAGKSILVGALSLLLGGRAPSDLVRSGANEASVEALFDLSDRPAARAAFESRGIAVEDGEVVIRRVIGANGRGRVTINGQMATIAMLAEITRGLIDISGQHEHVSLLDADHHIDRVDAYGDLSALRESVSEAHGEVHGLRSALDAIQMDEQEKARREDYLRFQLEEIAAIDPQHGEVESLEVERRRLKNSGELATGARRAEGALYSDEGAVVELLGRVQLELLQLARLDDRLSNLTSTASSALAEVEDLAHQLSRYASGIEADPSRLEEVEDRIEALKHLTRKHGGTIEGLLEARSAMAEELDSLEHDDARRADLSAALEAAEQTLSERALALSAARGKAAKALERAVQAELESLSMGQAKLEIQLVSLSEIGSKGAERAEILIAPNAGEPPRALRKTASGGELSRVLLAFKAVLARSDDVAAYVFDEIDSGVGGQTADVIGRKLGNVAKERQILAITHLPQVAAYAATHFRVRKEAEDGRTVSRVDTLDTKGAIEELARMLGGAEITDRSRKLAAELRARAAEVETVPATSRTTRRRPNR